MLANLFFLKRIKFLQWVLFTATVVAFPSTVFAAEAVEGLDLTHTPLGYLAIFFFVLAYALIISEENIHLKKSKPAVVAAGVGGSMLSIGSAAGAAVMGQARGVYTFFSHLKWTWAIVLGYFSSIATHFLINGELFLQGLVAAPILPGFAVSRCL